jgi:hypothetical protein
MSPSQILEKINKKPIITILINSKFQKNIDSYHFEKAISFICSIIILLVGAFLLLSSFSNKSKIQGATFSDFILFGMILAFAFLGYLIIFKTKASQNEMSISQNSISTSNLNNLKLLEDGSNKVQKDISKSVLFEDIFGIEMVDLGETIELVILITSEGYKGKFEYFYIDKNTDNFQLFTNKLINNLPYIEGLSDRDWQHKLLRKLYLV